MSFTKDTYPQPLSDLGEIPTVLVVTSHEKFLGGGSETETLVRFGLQLFALLDRKISSEMAVVCYPPASECVHTNAHTAIAFHLTAVKKEYGVSEVISDLPILTALETCDPVLHVVLDLGGQRRTTVEERSVVLDSHVWPKVLHFL
jgi:hypothetical protein